MVQTLFESSNFTKFELGQKIYEQHQFDKTGPFFNVFILQMNQISSEVVINLVAIF